MKRILSLALVLALCLCTMAVPTFAAGGVTENTARMVITDLDEYAQDEDYLRAYPGGSFDITIEIETPEDETIYTYETVLTWDPDEFVCIDNGNGDSDDSGELRYMDFLDSDDSYLEVVTYTFEPVIESNDELSGTTYYAEAFTLNAIVLNDAMDAVTGGKEVDESYINIVLVKEFEYEFTFVDSNGSVLYEGTIDQGEKYDFSWLVEQAGMVYTWTIDGESGTFDTAYMKSLTAESDLYATVTVTPEEYDVILPDDGSLNGNPEETVYGEDYEGTIPEEEYNALYDYQVQYRPDDSDDDNDWEDADMNGDEFTIPAEDIKEAIELQIGSKKLKSGIDVNVHEFVPGTTAAIMLIEVTGLDQYGIVGCDFDGNAMIKSLDYGSFVYLTQDADIAEAGSYDEAIDAATEMLESSDVQAATLEREGQNGYDVNCEFIGDGKVDIYDASVAFAAFTQSYTLDENDSSYDERNMTLYLRSDVDNNKKIEVNEYGAIKAYLLGSGN